MCITDGIHNKYIPKDAAIPEGWAKGNNRDYSRGKQRC